MPKTNIRVVLVGTDGNAYSVLAKVIRALKEGGRGDLVEQFKKDATSGDYDNLLRVVMEYVEVE